MLPNNGVLGAFENPPDGRRNARWREVAIQVGKDDDVYRIVTPGSDPDSQRSVE